MKFNPNPPLDCDRQTFKAYHDSLQDGEEVVDCSQSAMYGTRGVIYTATQDTTIGVKCVRWTLGKNWGKSAGQTMGTSVTWGTRRIADANES